MGESHNRELKFRDCDHAVLKPDVERSTPRGSSQHGMNSGRPLLRGPLRHACQGARLFLKAVRYWGIFQWNALCEG